MCNRACFHIFVLGVTDRPDNEEKANAGQVCKKIFILYHSSPVFSLTFLLIFSSFLVLCLVWLHVQLVAKKLSVVTNSFRVVDNFLSLSSVSLSASLCPLVGFCFVSSFNKHGHICISGAVFSVDVCISNSLCRLTCSHQRCWHRFNSWTPTIPHPGSKPLYQSD